MHLLRRREVLVEPPRQLYIPRDRRLAERADLLLQVARQIAAPLLVMVRQPLAQTAAVELVQRHAIARLPPRRSLPVQDVAHADAAERSQLAEAPQVRRHAVVNRLRRLAL